MAKNLILMEPRVRLEESTAFSGTGTAYVEKLKSSDSALTIWRIWGEGPPGTDYDACTNGSEYTDLTNLKKYIKTGDTSWTLLGEQVSA